MNFDLNTAEALKSNLNKEQLQKRDKEMIELYLNKVSIEELQKKYNLKYAGVMKVLRKAGVTDKRGQKEILRKSFFDNDVEESYYWLGYFIADGNLPKDKERVNKNGTITIKQVNQISLYSNDLSHLDKFIKFTNNLGKTVDRKTTNGNINRHYYFVNKSDKDYLLSIGVTPNKSTTLKISIPLNWHIIRGIFDGDGNIGKHIRPKITSASIEFINQMQEFFTKENINTSIVTKGNAFDLYVLSQGKKKFVNKLYKNANVFLERKKLQCAPLLSD